MQVRLEGISLKGKNKVREHGELWLVLQTRTNVVCLNGGTGYYLEAIGDKSTRWVAVKNDTDFKIEVLSYDNNIQGI